MARERLTPEQRSIINRASIEARWAPHRAAREAAGLPATVTEQLGRRPVKIADDTMRAYWIGRVRDLGIDAREAERRGIAEVTPRQLDRLAVALSESETARLTEAPTHERVDADTDDVRALIAYHSAEVARWRRSAEQERRLSQEHDRYADGHESALADLLMRGRD